MPRLFLIAATIAFLFFPAGTVLAQSTLTRPAATAPDAAAEPGATDAAKPKKKDRIPKKMTQQEIDRSIETRTVPERYRSSVPKEYQQYIPFDKR